MGQRITVLTFLLFTTFVPMLTAFAGRNPGLPRPAFLYGANLLAILACEALMWRHALPRLVNASVPDPVDAWRLVRRKFLSAMAVIVVGMVLALIEIALGFTSAYASYVYLLVIAVGGLVYPLRAHRRREERGRVFGEQVCRNWRGRQPGRERDTEERRSDQPTRGQGRSWHGVLP